jgi:hypothetical protein
MIPADAARSIRSSLRAAVARADVLVSEASAAVDSARERWWFDASADQLAGALEAERRQVDRQRAIVARLAALPDAALLEESRAVAAALDVLAAASSTLGTITDEVDGTSAAAYFRAVAADTAATFAAVAQGGAELVGGVAGGLLSGLLSQPTTALIVLGVLWYYTRGGSDA